MIELSTNVLILGAGTAGLNARRAAERAGAEAILVDPGPWGTTCARVGCMPSKLLIAAAEAAWHARHADVFGVHCEVRVDGPAVLARVRRERDRFTGFVLDDCARLEAEGKLIRGRGEVVARGEVLVRDEAGRPTHRVRHDRGLVVATGSRTFTPPPYRELPSERVLTNETIFEQPDLPDSVLVVGTGVIALELGQALHRLGSRVTLVGLDGLMGPLRDPRVREVARAVFAEELDLHDDHRLERVEAREDGVFLRFADPDGTVHEGTWSRVLLAAGRRPHLAGLGLERLGVALDDPSRLGPGGVPVHDPDTMQVGDLPVFLAGDVTGQRPLLHEAADEGRIAGTHAARWPEAHRGRRRTPLGIVFSDPQIATLGVPHDALPDGAWAAGEVDYRRQGRSRVMNQNRGIVRIYGHRRDGRLLGAEMLGPRVEHTAHLLAWAVQQGLTVDEALAMPFYHPVVEEGIRTALRDLRKAIGRG